MFCIYCSAPLGAGQWRCEALACQAREERFLRPMLGMLRRELLHATAHLCVMIAVMT